MLLNSYLHDSILSDDHAPVCRLLMGTVDPVLPRVHCGRGGAGGLVFAGAGEGTGLPVQHLLLIIHRVAEQRTRESPERGAREEES